MQEADIVRQVLGSTNAEAIKIVKKALQRGYDRKKLTDKLLNVIVDSPLASKLADRVIQENLLTGQNNNKAPSAGRKRITEQDAPNSQREKRPKLEPGNSPFAPDMNLLSGGQGPPTRNGTSVPLAKETESDEKPEVDKLTADIMLKAREQIEERKRQMNVSETFCENKIGKEKVTPSEARNFMQNAMEKHKRIEELKAKIAAKLSKPKGVPGATELGLSKVAPDQGTLDLEQVGAQIKLTQRMPTLKANIRAEKRQHLSRTMEETLKQLKQRDERMQNAPFFDSRIKVGDAARKPRHFSFHEPGSFVKQANRIRTKAKLEELQSHISQQAKKTGISQVAMLALSGPAADEAPVPKLEWWDSALLGTNEPPADPTNFSDFDLGTITSLVEHPIQIKAPGIDTEEAHALKVYLTKKEQKKLRRQNRKETLREKQEKVRLGFEAPPEPKVKISNLMRVLGNEAIQDPTKMEAHVREQMAKRQKKHEEDNLARKLTPQQRRAKKIKKHQEDTSSEVSVAVYSLLDLSNLSKKFKVEMNAKQWHMSGTIMLHKTVNVVVVEGGPKAQKSFKNLMMNRIKWEEDSVKSAKESKEEANKCVLIWEGKVPERNFHDFKVKSCPLEKMARDFFEQHKCVHYWDLALSIYEAGDSSELS